MKIATVKYLQTSIEDGVITKKPVYAVYQYTDDHWDMTRMFKIIENTVSADLIDHLYKLTELGYKIKFEKKEGD